MNVNKKRNKLDRSAEYFNLGEKRLDHTYKLSFLQVFFNPTSSILSFFIVIIFCIFSYFNMTEPWPVRSILLILLFLIMSFLTLSFKYNDFKRYVGEQRILVTDDFVVFGNRKDGYYYYRKACVVKKGYFNVAIIFLYYNERPKWFISKLFRKIMNTILVNIDNIKFEALKNAIERD